MINNKINESETNQMLLMKFPKLKIQKSLQ